MHARDVIIVARSVAYLRIAKEAPFGKTYEEARETFQLID